MAICVIKAAHVFCRYIYSTHDIMINTIYGGNVSVGRLVLRLHIWEVEVWIRPEFPLFCLKCTIVFFVTPGNFEGLISLLSISFHTNGMWIILRANLCDMTYRKTHPVAHEINITYGWILVTWIITQSLGNRRKQWLIYGWTPGRNYYIHTSLLTTDK